VTYSPSNPININSDGEITFELKISNEVEAKDYPIIINATASGQTIESVGINLEVLSNDFDNDGIKTLRIIVKTHQILDKRIMMKMELGMFAIQTHSLTIHLLYFILMKFVDHLMTVI
jgi:hypothetical protein